MKKMILALLTAPLFAFDAQAGEIKIADVIRNSPEYKQLASKYKALGGFLKCSDFKVTSTTDLQATLSGYTMSAKSVVAKCLVNPNDGGDPISEKLLAFVTITTQREEKKVFMEVASISMVTPPQPD